VAVKELSKSAIDRFRQLARQSERLDSTTLRESAPALIEKLRLRDGPYLKRAAVLLFHPDPEKFTTGAFVKIGYFRTNTELLYHDEIHGDLFTQVTQTMDLMLTKYLKAGLSYEGLQRRETFPVPEAALREALLNAVVHKDYSTGTPIQISVYPDKLMLWNPGELPPAWTVAKLKGKHPSRPFNPDVANAFFRAGMIEAWGRGIERIMEACRAARAPTPQIRYEPSGLWVEFKLPPGEVAGLGEKLGERLGENRAAIIRAIAANPKVTVVQLADQLRISTTAVENNLRYLKSQNLIARIGAAKGGVWRVQEAKP
jgi:ATP-dependent DNA helicase RecG